MDRSDPGDMTGLLKQIGSSDDPRRLIIELTLDRLATEDPEMAVVARLAAIPRRLELGVIAALFDKTVDTRRENEVLSRLLALDLVDAGRPVYHDSVRD